MAKPKEDKEPPIIEAIFIPKFDLTFALALTKLHTAYVNDLAVNAQHLNRIQSIPTFEGFLDWIKGQLS